MLVSSISCFSTCLKCNIVPRVLKLVGAVRSYLTKDLCLPGYLDNGISGQQQVNIIEIWHFDFCMTTIKQC